MKNLLFMLFAIAFFAIPVLAQDSTIETDRVISPAPSPAKKLPFEISEKKRLKPKDLKKKVEGWFPSGLPFVYFDANNGLGYGGRLLMTNNGSKEDPFFEYTPYRHRIFFHYSNTTKNAQWHSIDLDAPYILDSQFRLRANFVIDNNPNSLFYGIGEESMKGLSYHERNDPRGQRITNGRFDKREEAIEYMRPAQRTETIYVPGNSQLNSLILSNPAVPSGAYATDKKYNRYHYDNPNINISGERSFLKGLVRAVFGSRLSKYTINTYDDSIYTVPHPVYGNDIFNAYAPTVHGKTKLTEDHEAGEISGYDGGYVNLLRFGLVYDTRDFEPDPSKGLFLEVTHERSEKAIGSDYQYNKMFYSGRFFYSPFPKTFEKLVLAGRVAFVNSKGNVPFYEYRNMWGTEGNISGLGGRTTLRGYMQDRFIGRAMGFGNMEVRWKFYEVPGFAFNLVPFFDFGRVWDEARKANLKDYKYSYGAGLRIAWNQSTIIYIDVASSRENSGQVYMNFNHIF